MNYKNKNDIDFRKYVELQESIKDEPTNELLVLFHTKRLFNPSDYKEFANALITDAKPSLNFDIDLKFAKASKFIDCDTFIKDLNILEFLNLVLIPKKWWRGKNFKVTLADAEEVIRLFQNAQPK